MTVAYIGLGSNLAEPESQLRRALADLNQLPESRCLAHSSLYRSPPLTGPNVPAGQPDYLNAVAALETKLTPAALLVALQGLENQHQRQRTERWGPRTLDLDLLLFGEQIIHTPELSVPHPGLSERHFVLYPLAELLGERAADFQIPGQGSLAGLLAACPCGELKKLTT